MALAVLNGMTASCLFVGVVNVLRMGHEWQKTTDFIGMLRCAQRILCSLGDSLFTITPVIGSRLGSSVAQGRQSHFVCFLTDSACLPERMGKTYEKQL
jgi:hypothetical protein